jgi:hypothetical protein
MALVVSTPQKPDYPDGGENTHDAPPLPAGSSPKPTLKPPGSSLAMTEDQLTTLVEYVCNKVDELKKEKHDHGWDRERDDYIDQHEDEFKFREKEEGSIFRDSNLSFNQSRRNTLPIVARLTKDYLAVDGFYAIEPTRLTDQSLAPRIQNYSKYKLGRSNLRACLLEAIDRAAVVGERVVKITHAERSSFYKETDIVLVDETGSPVRTSKGDVIYSTDEWVAPQTEQDDMQKPLTFVQGIVAAIFPAKGPLVLKKDPTVAKPDKEKYVKCTYPMKHVAYAGPDCSGVHHKDFLCGLREKDVQTAPIIAHLYDLDVTAAIERYVIPYQPADLDDPMEKAFMLDLMSRVNALKNEDNTAKSATLRPHREDHEMAEPAQDDFHALTQLAEAYLSLDVDGDGIIEEICITVDLKNRFAYDFDYTPNVVHPSLGRPFRVIRTLPLVDRWYGISEYKVNRHKQWFIDWSLNRLVYDASLAGKIRGYNPKAAAGWDRNPPVPGDVWHKFEDPELFEKGVVTIEMPTLDDNTFQLMQTMMQASQAERGNLAPGGDTISNLPSSKLKYGIEAIQRSGDELYALTAILIKEPLMSVVDAAMKTMLAHMDEVEEYEFTEGDHTLSDTMNRSEIEDLKFNVSLDLTLARGDQIVEQNEAAMDKVVAYLQQPAFMQAVTRPFLLRYLRAMEIPDPDKALPTPTPEAIAASLQPPQPPQGPGGPPQPGGAPGAPMAPPPPGPTPSQMPTQPAANPPLPSAAADATAGPGTPGPAPKLV